MPRFIWVSMPFVLLVAIFALLGCSYDTTQFQQSEQENCPTGYERCAGDCVSLTSDSHCGMCGNVCADNASCVKGADGNYACQCVTGYATCASEKCAIELATNISHCGGCFNKCGPGEECVGGECFCKTLGTAGTKITDENRATVFLTALENCGQCGYDCKVVSADNTRCVEGHCVCGGDGDQLMTSCPDVAEACSIDLNSDRGNCGQCGNACATEAEIENFQCKNGKCDCLDGWIKCGNGKCVPSKLMGNELCAACGIGHHRDAKTKQIVAGCADDQACEWDSTNERYACFCGKGNEAIACRPYSLGCRSEGADERATSCACEYLKDEKGQLLPCVKIEEWLSWTFSLPYRGDGCKRNGKCSCAGASASLCTPKKTVCIAKEGCVGCKEYVECLDNESPLVCTRKKCLEPNTPDCLKVFCDVSQGCRAYEECFNSLDRWKCLFSVCLSPQSECLKMICASVQACPEYKACLTGKVPDIECLKKTCIDVASSSCLRGLCDML